MKQLTPKQAIFRLSIALLVAPWIVAGLVYYCALPFILIF